MIPYEIDYARASSLQETFALLAESPDAKLLAGGHTLIPLLKLRLAQPGKLIDISRVEELTGIAFDQGVVAIGSMTTHAQLEASALLQKICPLFSIVGKVIADPAVRNRGTIGGSLVNADPSADWPAVMLALNAEMEIASHDGSRKVPADKFFVDLLTSVVESHEVLTRIYIRPVQGARVAYRKFRHPASGYAVAAAAVNLTYENGRCVGGSIGVTGVGATAFKPVAAEKLLSAGFSGRPGEIDRLCDAAFDGVEALEDSFATSDYRTQLGRTMLKRALQDALLS